jgi:hypothetical protein
MKHKKKKKKDEQTEEDKLDEALRDSFPASDPIQMTEPAPKDEPPVVKPPPHKEEHHRSPRP